MHRSMFGKQGNGLTSPNPKTDTSAKGLVRNYDRAAWFYETSAKIYSTNQIRSSKRYQLNHIQPGDRVLYLGAGTGEDAIMAARAGADVTCIDISQGMLDRVQHRFEAESLNVNLICANAFDYVCEAPFDVVAANYFLNVFRRHDMEKMLQQTARFVRPGGLYLIADVARSQGNLLAQAFNIVYLKTAMISFWLLGLVPLHENYDYVSRLASAGLQHQHTEFFRFAKVGPILFQSIVAQRIE